MLKIIDKVKKLRESGTAPPPFIVEVRTWAKKWDDTKLDELNIMVKLRLKFSIERKL